MVAVNVERVADVFVDVTDALAVEFDMIDFLQVVSVRAAELAGVRTAGLLLNDRQGLPRFAAASDERRHVLTLFQMQAAEGPGLDCCVSGEPVSGTWLRSAADRWPEFAPRAVAAGFDSVHALPVRLYGKVIGVLVLLGAGPGPMDPVGVQVTRALAGVAAFGLLSGRAAREGDLLADRLQVALGCRTVIEQAKGVLAQQYGISVDEAFERLRDHVHRHGLYLSDVARSVVSQSPDAPDLTVL